MPFFSSDVFKFCIRIRELIALNKHANRNKTANLFGYTDCYSRLFPASKKMPKQRQEKNCVCTHLNLAYNYVRTNIFLRMVSVEFCDYNQSKLPLYLYERSMKKEKKIQPTGMSLTLAQQAQSITLYRPDDLCTETETDKHTSNLFVRTLML